MKPESSTEESRVITRGRRPICFQQARSSGTFKSKAQAPTLMWGVRWARAVARPETPPGAMSLGTVNTAMGRPTSTVPSRIKTRSSRKPFQPWGPRIFFIGIVSRFQVNDDEIGKSESRENLRPDDGTFSQAYFVYGKKK